MKQILTTDSNNKEKQTIGLKMVVIHLNLDYSQWFAFNVAYTTAT